MKKLILGVDEAGRGAVIGPLVMGGVLFLEDKKELKSLSLAGVKDSKLLTSKKREELYKLVKKSSQKHIALKISPTKIDRESLNDLEIKYTSRIINKLYPHIDFIDVPSSGKGIKRYCDKVKNGCNHSAVIEGGNRMESKSILVAAASIVAKETREIELRKLHKEYGDFGSGYPSDPKTREWLINWKKKNKKWPKIVRNKW